MDRSRIIRIALMIAVIFAAGIGIGYYLIKPAQPDLTLRVLGKSGKVISPQTIVQYYDRHLNLSADQKRMISRAAAQFVADLTETQPRTQERFDVFKRYYPRLREILRPDQLAAFDELTRQHTERMQHALEK
jgi:hypothetical protein